MEASTPKSETAVTLSMAEKERRGKRKKQKKEML